ncbi:MAG: hypothetical protein E7536_09015 [Ruminococcaceae bacterium]|nr:hypothetical protein [Oscillospiraceae bacterium]
MTDNPIKSPAVKCPQKYQWDLEDVSKSDAGRTEDGTMEKGRIGQVVKLSLSWGPLTTDEISEILQAFNPEYINVTYLDPQVGGYTTAQFYVGNRSTPLYNSALGLWSNLSFNLIRRKAEMIT